MASPMQKGSIYSLTVGLSLLMLEGTMLNNNCDFLKLTPSPSATNLVIIPHSFLFVLPSYSPGPSCSKRH